MYPPPPPGTRVDVMTSKSFRGHRVRFTATVVPPEQDRRNPPGTVRLLRDGAPRPEIVDTGRVYRKVAEPFDPDPACTGRTLSWHEVTELARTDDGSTRVTLAGYGPLVLSRASTPRALMVGTWVGLEIAPGRWAAGFLFAGRWVWRLTDAQMAQALRA